MLSNLFRWTATVLETLSTPKKFDLGPQAPWALESAPCGSPSLHALNDELDRFPSLFILRPGMFIMWKFFQHLA